MSKAAAQRPKKSTFYEIVMEGSPKTVCGLLAGLMLGSGLKGTAYFCHAEGINYESFGGKLAELIRVQPRDCHVIVDSTISSYLKKLGGRIEETTGMRISSVRYIRSASLAFSFHTYAFRHAQEILDKLNSLPPGLRLVDFETEEKLNPDAVGVEAYTPAHDYEMEGEGKIVGRIDLLIEARRELAGLPLIKLDLIDLNLA